MIRHILLIRFTDLAMADQVAETLNAFLKIPEYVHGVMNVECGKNDSREGKNEKFSHCVLMTFYNETARQEYLSHPEHIRLKKIFRPILESIIVFDYTLDACTR
ncbi:Dabb family protein [Salmonella enterica]|nr:Dabb family protein [Salmonella enterica]ECC3213530.1 Dabb family protein [Salmonella enterica subsp. diarizonae]EAR4440194.1 Dabb family protein [Salmonella enterica]EDQ3623288.1 Dabb family protein [Salmonella enterica subsp. diarizonae]EIY5515265.1 Dabb family protein [Salmonella enterica]